MGCAATDPDYAGGAGTGDTTARGGAFGAGAVASATPPGDVPFPRAKLRRKIRGATSVVVGTFSAPFAAGDAAGLRMSGSTLTAYRRTGNGTWAGVGSATDTSIAAGGYVSFTLGDTTVRGGAIGGGSIEGGGT